MESASAAVMVCSHAAAAWGLGSVAYSYRVTTVTYCASYRYIHLRRGLDGWIQQHWQALDGRAETSAQGAGS